MSRFYYSLTKIVALFSYALELHGDILKLSNGVFNKKNFDDKSTERCILNTIKPIQLGLESNTRIRQGSITRDKSDNDSQRIKLKR